MHKYESKFPDHLIEIQTIEIYEYNTELLNKSEWGMSELRQTVLLSHCVYIFPCRFPGLQAHVHIKKLKIIRQ